MRCSFGHSSLEHPMSLQVIVRARLLFLSRSVPVGRCHTLTKLTICLHPCCAVLCRAAQASAGQTEGGAEEEDEGEQEEDFIRQQLREMSIDEIAGILASRGEDTSGSQEELIDRLAAILEPELER